MLALEASLPVVRRTGDEKPWHLVMGVTSAQTCLVVQGRLQALQAAGFRVTVISAPGELLRWTTQSTGAERVEIPMRRGISPIADLVSMIRMMWTLQRLKPDVVEFSTPKAGLLGMLAAAFCRVPVRIYLLRGLRLELEQGWKRHFLLAAERIAAGCAHVVLCNSRSLRDEATRLGIAPAARLIVLGDGSSNGVDVERFAPGPSRVRQELKIPAEARVLGFVGRMTNDKGLPELMEAFAQVLRHEPKTWLLLVGWFDAAEDALSRTMRERIESHPQVICTGFVRDTAPYYRAMDVLILPTWREGMPNAALEAASSGVPVITTLSTGSRDAVAPDVTGVLVQPGDPEAICEAVLNLLRDEAHRQWMGETARGWVARRFSDDRVLRLTTEFYRSLVCNAEEDDAIHAESAIS